VLAEPEEHRRGKWDVLMLSRELRSKYSGEVESRMPLQTARTGSERGVRATLKRATGPYSTTFGKRSFTGSFNARACDWQGIRKSSAFWKQERQEGCFQAGFLMS